MGILPLVFCLEHWNLMEDVMASATKTALNLRKEHHQISTRDNNEEEDGGIGR